MDQLIPIVNKLQDVFGAIGYQAIDLPQIVVVGSQSAGKSSVLENIVGRLFTKRFWNCYKTTFGFTASDTENEIKDSRGDEYGEFIHLPGQKFFDFTEIRAEIQRETDRITGKNKGISNKSINLKIFSPFVLNLTLVDLPGITKVPTGDQPEDIEEQIRMMCYEFIKNPNAIILAVTAANQDLANSDGLKIARSVDPDGDRTIGVLTKVDIMDQGTDCSDVLMNKVIPLRKGYVAIINRSQKDIQEDLPIRKGILKEKAFFASHPKYKHLPNKCGTITLSKTLNQVLIHHIRDCLPEIKNRINSLLKNVQRDVESLGESVTDYSPSARGGVLLKILSQFATNFGNNVEGRGPRNRPSSEMSELFGAARISIIFNELFGKRIRNFNAFDGLNDDDIRTTIANATGTRPSLFVPEISFDLLVRKQIARLEAPGLQCVEMVQDEIHRIIIQSQTMELTRFPDLLDKTMEIVTQLLRNCVQPAQKMISNLILIETAYINTSHPDFIGGKNAVAIVQGKAAALNASIQSNKKNQTNEIQHESVKTESVQNATNTGTGITEPSNLGSNSTKTPTVPLSVDNPSGSVGFFQMGNRSPPLNAKKLIQNNPNNALNQSSSTATNSNIPTHVGGSDPQLFNNVSVRSHSRDKGSSLSQPNQSSSLRGSTSGSGGGNNRSSNFSYHTNNASDYSNEMQLVRLAEVPDRMRCNPIPTDKERAETEIIKILISSYFEIVKKNFCDLVPKTIMHFLVTVFKENLQNELVSQLYKENIINELMKETDDVSAKRQNYKEMRDLLFKAIEIVNEVRDFDPSK